MKTVVDLATPWAMKESRRSRTFICIGRRLLTEFAGYADETFIVRRIARSIKVAICRLVDDRQ